MSGIDRSTYCATLRIAQLLGMTATERRKYEQSVSSSTQDGRFGLYKTRGDHEAELGRKQHGYPSPEGLAG